MEKVERKLTLQGQYYSTASEATACHTTVPFPSTDSSPSCSAFLRCLGRQCQIRRSYPFSPLDATGHPPLTPVASGSPRCTSCRQLGQRERPFCGAEWNGEKVRLRLPPRSGSPPFSPASQAVLAVPIPWSCSAYHINPRTHPLPVLPT